jgi:hypothetical protein
VTVAKGGEVFAIAVRQVQHDTRDAVPGDIQTILHDFQQVLEEPTTLPPTREFDHCITLKDGMGPINVRPYRYAHFQKMRSNDKYLKCFYLV